LAGPSGRPRRPGDRAASTRRTSSRIGARRDRSNGSALPCCRGTPPRSINASDVDSQRRSAPPADHSVPAHHDPTQAGTRGT
jgi:hypothetical protein